MFLETFKRGKEKCSQALIMSDINTDSEAEKARSIQSSKKSSIIGPFPAINFDEAGFSSCNGGNTETTEKTNLTSASNAHIKINKQVSSTNEQFVANGIRQLNLMHETHNRKEQIY